MLKLKEQSQRHLPRSSETPPLPSPQGTCVSRHPNAHPGHGVGVTFVHCRRNWATDTQGFIFWKGVTEVPQHGCPQALAAVLPPHKHGVKDRQQIACTGAVTTEAACRKARDMCCVVAPPTPRARLHADSPRSQGFGQEHWYRLGAELTSQTIIRYQITPEHQFSIGPACFPQRPA